MKHLFALSELTSKLSPQKIKHIFLKKVLIVNLLFTACLHQIKHTRLLKQWMKIQMDRRKRDHLP